MEKDPSPDKVKEGTNLRINVFELKNAWLLSVAFEEHLTAFQTAKHALQCLLIKQCTVG